VNKELAYYKGPSEIVNATPQDFFNALNEEFEFTLDPCANKQNHKCEKWFGPESPHGTDGLAESWQGHRVFMNPPYARNQIYHWVKKAYEESLDKNTLVVALIRSATDTKYFHDFCWKIAELRFVKGRLRFNNAQGPAPFPSLVVIWK
jgi:site-specific DNA-methyltransferase (adenine-specific)